MKLRPTWWVAVLLLGWCGVARAQSEVIPLETPAYFVEVFGTYAHRETAEGATQVGMQQFSLPEASTRTWEVGGLATVPIRWGLGTRIRVFGGSSRASQSGNSSEIGTVTGQAEIFWRDPTKGQLGAGYGYGWGTPRTQSSITSIKLHTLPVFASLYMPDLGGGAVDWNAALRYDWLEISTTTTPIRWWVYEIRGWSIWYVNQHVAFEGGLRYQRLIAAQDSDELEGTFELEVLVPTGTRHFGTVSLIGAVGRVEQKELPSPFDSLSRLSWQIGAQVTLHFPGVPSLIALNRAYR